MQLMENHYRYIPSLNMTQASDILHVLDTAYVMENEA